MAKNNKKQHRTIQPLINENASFQIKEAFKTLRTNLVFTLAAANKKSVVISSSILSEGKSTVCANLAITMSQMGSRVLVMDMDLRKPMLHRLFKLPNSEGLTSFLCNEKSNIDDVIKKDVFENLDVVTSGPTPPNPSELLSMAKLQASLDELCEKYDYIFIDTPPVNIVSDALIVSKYTAGVLLVAKQATTTAQELEHAVSAIKFAEVPVLGTVLNQIDTSGSRYGYGKYKYGKYKYGYYNNYGEYK
ncbi:MAG: CpsD/CapB family tyrosine-protein kinase [Oscillospiraceae bacterium]|nr:CpsD/CapB family tyrosine-protein kinase [Oscillospiraceae bacterium]